MSDVRTKRKKRQLPDQELPFQKHLQKAICEEIEHCGSVMGLAAAIGKANSNAACMHIDRRKLSAIAMGAKGIGFSFAELHAIDTYLLRRGKGLKTLLDAPLLLQALTHREKITFLLGAKSEPRITYVSHWDARSLSALLPVMDRVSGGTHFAIKEVLLKKALAASNKTGYMDLFRSEGWLSLIESTDAQHARSALVCLGSPRSCHAAEVMLCTMFQRRAFQQIDTGREEKPLPFCFLWTQNIGLPSAFASTIDIGNRSRVATGWKTHGVRIGDEELLPDRKGGSWSEYGIFAMQRRPTGQIWLVIAGLTGPATYGTAQFLESYSAELPEGSVHRGAPVLWGAVETNILLDEDGEGDARRVASHHLLQGPCIWGQ